MESLGIRRTLFGSMITEAYREKVLSIPKPQIAKDLRSAIGVIGYIGRYIDDYAFYKYWFATIIKEL